MSGLRRRGGDGVVDVEPPDDRPAAPAAAAGVEPELAEGLDVRDVEREAALIRLYSSEAKQLQRLATLLGAGNDAEDVVAEAFCDLHRRWRRLRDPEAAPAYLRSMVCNLVRMRVRQLQVARRHATVACEEASSAESHVLLREDQVELVRALRALPERQREALVLRYWMDLKESEVAAAMGITPGSVKVHTSRGMAALSKALEGTR